MTTTKKLVIAVVALALALLCAIGGTLAYLVAKSNTVTNTFTYGDINIALKESDNLDLKMIPGKAITKDPKVTVLEDSEACWLFVKVEESENFDTFMTYAIAEGWTLYNTDKIGSNIETDKTTADTYVIYRDVNADTAKAGTFYYVLGGKEEYQNGYVTVNDTVTKEMLNDFDTDKSGELSEEEKAALPKLTFTAYAVQRDNLTLEQAYDQAFNAN